MNFCLAAKALWLGASSSALIALGSYLTKYIGGHHFLEGWASGVTMALIILWYYYLKTIEGWQ